MAIKENDFVELDYEGYLEDGSLFDTTKAEVAKKHDAFEEKGHYHATIICVGQNHVVPGLDDALVGKEPGHFELTIPPEHAFGKKNAKLLKLLPLKIFKDQEIQPFPGLEVDVDGERGIIKTVSGGRTIVDFNHPLSSHSLTYKVDVKRIVVDKKEQVEAVLHIIGIPYKNVEVTEKKATITTGKLPEELQKGLMEEISKLTNLDTIEFAVMEKQNA
ncbi:MAG: FKBP-type peptidyl-prolyl cis-trans isomerase [Candidatus Woesearchaeota archaeon]